MAEAELSLVNKAELRIALASTDEQFQHSLSLYLCPILLKLSSPHVQVRQAVLKIVQHLIPRITAARSITLPIDALVQQVKSPRVGPGVDAGSVQLYSTLFIFRGIDRITDEQRIKLVPDIIDNIHLYSDAIRARMFSIFSKLLTSWKAPFKGTDEYDAMRTTLGFDKNAEVEKYLSFTIAKFLLLLPDSNNKATPGLSLQDNSFFTSNAGVTYKTREEIFTTKRNLLEFLKAGFQNDQLALPLLVASADPSSSINESAEGLFKRLNIELDDVTIYGNVSLIDHLVLLFLGQPGIPAVDSNLQYKILRVLIKSTRIRLHPEISVISKTALHSDNPRIRQLAITFISWLGQSDNVNQELEQFNLQMVGELRNDIISEGWPSMELQGKVNFAQRIKDRQLKYETLGNILKSYPQIIDWSFIEFLYGSLEGDQPELRVSIQDALSGLSMHLSKLSQENKYLLKRLAAKYLTASADNVNISACRYIAIKHINSAFPFEDSETRFLSILGSSRENAPETIEEAQNGIHPYWFNIRQVNYTTGFKSTSYLLGQETSVIFPSFGAFMNVLTEEIDKAKSVQNSSIFKSLPTAILFAQQALVMESIKGNETVIIPDQDWAVRLDKAIEVNDKVRNLVTQHMENISIHEPIVQLLNLCIDALIGQSTHTVPTDTTYGTILSRIISFSSSPIVEFLIPRVAELVALLDKVHDEITISQICKAIGIIATHPSNVNSSIKELVVDLGLNNKTNILAVSYIISRLYLRDRVNIIDETTLVSHLDILEKMLQEQGSAYYSALDSISQLSMFGVLGPIQNQGLSNYVTTFKNIIKLKVKKIDEKSVLTLGYLILANNRDAIEGLSEDEQSIYDTHISKQIEYIFTSAESLTIAAAGWDSSVLSKQLDIPGEIVKYIPRDTSRAGIILDSVLGACKNTKPALRRAGCVWLLSLVQHCSKLEAITSRAGEIHVAFMKFLADRDELIQESASRGLGLVYELGDVELKDTLVKSLLKSFTSTTDSVKITAGTVESDTQLFEPDVLKTDDGSISTYKDVLNLAQEVGDPTLVYKFMSLAKSSSLWTSRKGIAYGLESILSQTSLDSLLAKDSSMSNRLIPKLFRYRYDPNEGVAKSMNDIWNSLIKDTSKAVTANLDPILAEVLKSMGRKEWRVRQAGTAALNDLLTMVEVEDYETKLDDIWTMSFRVMDDIKESVRKEATKLTKVLTTELTRLLESSSYKLKTEKISGILSILIPFFLGNKGVLSDSADVRNFSLEILSKLCKSNNKAIKSYVPELIENFILLFSSLEPEVINYLALNASKYNIDNNAIDASRLTSIGKSPLMEVTETLLSQLDDSNLPEFIIRLESAIKKSVGLPSKVCGSRVIVSLIMNHYQVIKPYGDKLLAVSSAQIKDRNDTIASSYAGSSGYLCRIASTNSILKYSEMIKKMYFESEDDRFRSISSVAADSVSKYAGDKFDLVSSAFLPLAYIGKFDAVEQVRENFDRVWIEHSGGKSAIKLYLAEIVDLIKKYIQSNKFEVRKTLARTLSDVSKSIDNLNEFSEPLIHDILSVLLEANKGKSWEGKELIFDALVSFAILSKSYISQHEDVHQAIEKTVTIEVKRRNKEYQKHVVLSVGKYIHEFHNEEVVDLYIQIMGKVLSDGYYQSDDDSDVEMDEVEPITVKENINLEESRLHLLQNLTEAFYIPVNDSLFTFVFNQIKEIFQSKIIANTWRSKVQTSEIYIAIIDILKDTKLKPNQVEFLLRTWNYLKLQSLLPESIENVKIQFIKLSYALIKYLTIDDAKVIKESLEEFAKNEPSSIVLTELRNALA
ncbi:uncharacterized protein SPAPADRAFT_51799 [Spathaspora passalidarum NRRL Y-27907]|uniref:Proteasome component ECM29 n=1 Tax=Spathaspora passalidarum (strain NRRL Y-27907 / 11-Y1) TaxID=619300 RepID=G3ARX7_SPAPN|nr:uncharacterized protein SPAPADRAFT_51799 [Spathaspora passalidarum NRRL Y-27907]EGW31826.1 hypothetical protein SPAPADRAFT_51799 [Spathaspora passalidarum NRRL Y-27907]